MISDSTAWPRRLRSEWVLCIAVALAAAGFLWSSQALLRIDLRLHDALAYAGKTGERGPMIVAIAKERVAETGQRIRGGAPLVQFFDQAEVRLQDASATEWRSLAIRSTALHRVPWSPASSRTADLDVLGRGLESTASVLIHPPGEATHRPDHSASETVHRALAASDPRDKLWPVGVSGGEARDRYSTPHTFGKNMALGPEAVVSANEGAFSERTMRIFSAPEEWSVGIIFILLAMVSFRWLGSRWHPLASSLSVSAVALAASTSFFIGLNLWWPPTAWVAAALVGHLCWNWRRLSITIEELDQKALRLRSLKDRRERGVNRWGNVADALDSALDAQRHRDEMLRLLSHDMRSPQSAILALLQTYKRHAGANLELCERIEAHVDSALKLSDDFAAMLRVESGDYHPQEVELGQMLYEVHIRATPLAHARQVALELSIQQVDEDVGTYWTKGDMYILDRCFFKLAEYAITQSTPGTRCVIGLEWGDATPSRRVVVSFSNQGSGMSEAMTRRVFERNARFDPESSGASKTLPNIDLAVVKTAVDRHGGAIRCRSRLGVGTTFAIELPEAPEERI